MHYQSLVHSECERSCQLQMLHTLYTRQEGIMRLSMCLTWGTLTFCITVQHDVEIEWWGEFFEPERLYMLLKKIKCH